MNHPEYKIGIISDTHGVFPPDVYDLFKGVDKIIHAGDIGGEDVLTELETIAPVIAVYGNTDTGALRRRLKERIGFSLGGYDIIVVHFPLYFGDETAPPTIRISGHTHKPLILERAGSMLINPGSAAFPRGEYNSSVAVLSLSQTEANARIIYI